MIGNLETHIAETENLRLSAERQIEGWVASVYDKDKADAWKSPQFLASETEAKNEARNAAAQRLGKSPEDLDLAWKKEPNPSPH